MSNSAINSQYATPAELKTILGESWAICRNTEANRVRHGNCITRQQYVSATKSALAMRVNSPTNAR